MAMAMAMAVAEATAGAVPPVSARVVGNAFVRQYYYIQHQWPELVHRFYEDISKLGRPEDNGTMSITTTMQDINKKILSLNYGENRAKIKSVDAQESYNGGVHVLVTGYLMGKDNMIRNFTQTFFLAPQEKGYFVLNDILRYVEDINHINGEEAFNPLDSWEVSSMEEEEVPVAEVVDESPDDSQIVVESNSKIEEVLKKSYASIVMDTKESAVPLSSPAPTSQRSVAKGQEQQVNLDQASASVVEEPVSGSDAIETGNNHEGEDTGIENLHQRFGDFKQSRENSKQTFKALKIFLEQVSTKFKQSLHQIRRSFRRSIRKHVVKPSS